eukprot:NODE_30_length_3687_cov_359.708906_g17_i2.p1 GENE.NODE_30_length_3687_cov_359.708906_g17_i2~~NODE_30_length_3687_cov_359.708906_g17_i2.p1  ORF type:complete len:1062 (+),score=205.32 NODE_30_length_3687_cov_359.708906_g17_i2:70-3255(+)
MISNCTAEPQVIFELKSAHALYTAYKSLAPLIGYLAELLRWLNQLGREFREKEGLEPMLEDTRDQKKLFEGLESFGISTLTPLMIAVQNCVRPIGSKTNDFCHSPTDHYVSESLFADSLEKLKSMEQKFQDCKEKLETHRQTFEKCKFNPDELSRFVMGCLENGAAEEQSFKECDVALAEARRKLTRLKSQWKQQEDGLPLLQSQFILAEEGLKASNEALRCAQRALDELQQKHIMQEQTLRANRTLSDGAILEQRRKDLNDEQNEEVDSVNKQFKKAEADLCALESCEMDHYIFILDKSASMQGLLWVFLCRAYAAVVALLKNKKAKVTVLFFDADVSVWFQNKPASDVPPTIPSKAINGKVKGICFEPDGRSTNFSPPFDLILSRFSSCPKTERVIAILVTDGMAPTPQAITILQAIRRKIYLFQLFAIGLKDYDKTNLEELTEAANGSTQWAYGEEVVMPFVLEVKTDKEIEGLVTVFTNLIIAHQEAASKMPALIQRLGDLQVRIKERHSTQHKHFVETMHIKDQNFEAVITSATNSQRKEATLFEASVNQATHRCSAATRVFDSVQKNKQATEAKISELKNAITDVQVNVDNLQEKREECKKEVASARQAARGKNDERQGWLKELCLNEEKRKTLEKCLAILMEECPKFRTTLDSTESMLAQMHDEFTDLVRCLGTIASDKHSVSTTEMDAVLVQAYKRVLTETQRDDLGFGGSNWWGASSNKEKLLVSWLAIEPPRQKDALHLIVEGGMLTDACSKKPEPEEVKKLVTHGLGDVRNKLEMQKAREKTRCKEEKQQVQLFTDLGEPEPGMQASIKQSVKDAQENFEKLKEKIAEMKTSLGEMQQKSDNTKKGTQDRDEKKEKRKLENSISRLEEAITDAEEDLEEENDDVKSLKNRLQLLLSAQSFTPDEVKTFLHSHKEHHTLAKTALEETTKRLEELELEELALAAAIEQVWGIILVHVHSSLVGVRKCQTENILVAMWEKTFRNIVRPCVVTIQGASDASERDLAEMEQWCCIEQVSSNPAICAQQTAEYATISSTDTATHMRSQSQESIDLS